MLLWASAIIDFLFVPSSRYQRSLNLCCFMLNNFVNFSGIRQGGSFDQRGARAEQGEAPQDEGEEEELVQGAAGA